MPIASVTTANIGTPSTKAANIRCTSAVIHTNARAPIRGNSPYARVVSAAAWTARSRCCVIRYSSSLVRHEKRLPLREVDRQGAAHLREHLGCDFPASLPPRPILYSLHHDATHERRNPRHALARRVGPHERWCEVVAIGERARGLDEGDLAPPRRLVCARRIGREHVPFEPEGAR